MKKTSILFCILYLSAFASNAQLLKNDFMTGIALGESIEKGVYNALGEEPLLGQWNRASRANNTSGSSPVAVAPLTYPDYVESGASYAFQLAKITESGKSRLTGYSLTTDNYLKGETYYLAFMLNVSNTTVATPHAAVIMFDGSYAVDYQRICVCVGKSTTAGKMRIGIVDKDFNNAGGTAAYSAADYNFGETYLVVLKYNFFNGKAELFVNPTLTETEPASLASITNTDLSSIKGISVRQRTNQSSIIGGIRFATSWKSAIGLDENDEKEYANSYQAVDSRLHYSGRVNEKDTTVVMNWSGSYVTVKFTGKNLAVVLSGGNGKLAVYIDGVKQSKYLATGIYPLVYSLADDLTDGEHEVVLRKVQKSSLPITLHAFKSDGVLQQAVVNKAVRIEYFGNSITDGLSGGAPDNASRDNQAYNDASLAYPCRLAEMLDAEYYSNAISGIALCKGAGWVADGMENRFDKRNPFGNSPEWDFSSFTPSICVMALGVNDNNNPGDITWSTWRERYKSVVQRLKTEYGDHTAFLFAVGPMAAPTSNAVVNMLLLVEELKDLGFNAHGYVYSFKVNGHPIASEHQAMAEELYNYITTNGIITDNPQIPKFDKNSRIVSEKYYSIGGQRVSKPAGNGIYIRKAVYESGETVSEKVQTLSR